MTDAGLAHLTSLVRLRALDLFGARISDAGCAHLRLAFQGGEAGTPADVQSYTTLKCSDCDDG